MAEHEDTELIKSTDTIHRKGKWFRPGGRGFWHLEAHSEYGVVWSKCGIRIMRSNTETRESLTEGEGDVVCGRCAAKEAQEG